jgi:sigma-54 dependent transcriptional regulator, flagellar regulatory protein
MEQNIGLIGSSNAIQAVERLIAQVAKTQANVLVLGESGTGKEMVARIIHQSSCRAMGPFVAVNCAAIPLELLESELFGHEKGSFTGAAATRQGRFELAAGGTLFLDEIGDMPLAMQAKLLRVLQERSFERVGGNKSIKADVRIITATHKHLADSILEGEFREDLYYRLNVFPIEIPPLRNRKEDIHALIQHFIQQFKTEINPGFELATSALEYLENYEWPGNVRELANLVERMMILFANQKVEESDLYDQFFPQKSRPSRRDDKDYTIMTVKELPEAGFDLKEHLTQLECAYISQALNENRGIVSRAAKRLGLRRTTLVEKMKKYGMGRG